MTFECGARSSETESGGLKYGRVTEGKSTIRVKVPQGT